MANRNTIFGGSDWKFSEINDTADMNDTLSAIETVLNGWQ